MKMAPPVVEDSEERDTSPETFRQLVKPQFTPFLGWLAASLLKLTEDEAKDLTT